MEKTVTVSVRHLVTTALVTVAVLAAYVVGTAQGGASAASAAEGDAAAATPSIVMTGTGEATAVPDQLSFELEVATRASDVSSALQSADNAVRRVVKAVRDHDIAFKDVQTAGLSIRPVYDYSGSGPGVITAYAVSEDLSVLVRDLPVAGATISAAVAAGGNTVWLHDVRLKVGDKDALLREARAAAIEEAQDKADQYAAAAGGSLGAVSSIREVHVNQSSNREYLTASFDALPSASVPIRPGTSELQVTVSVVWDLA